MGYRVGWISPISIQPPGRRCLGSLAECTRLQICSILGVYAGEGMAVEEQLVERKERVTLGLLTLWLRLIASWDSTLSVRRTMHG